MIPEEFLGTERRVNKLKGVLEKRQTSLTIILENINDPHNVSAAIRSCDAVGMLEVCAIYHSGQSTPKLGEASSASARKWVDVKRFNSVDDCYAYVRASGKKIFTTHLAQDSTSLYDMNLTEPVALVFGNEHAGVTDEALAKADGNFLIPQVGVIQSLNISVACAVSIFEAFRQRLAAGMYDNPCLNSEQVSAKLQEWMKK